MRITNKLKNISTLVSAAALLMSLFGCVKNSPVQPELTSDTKRTTEQITFLKASTARLGKVFNVEQTVGSQGGTVLAGDNTTGISSITFPAGALSQNLNITFDWDSENFTADFSPHGAQFNSDVTIRLSYKDADLDGVDENDLRIWYYDEEENLWELAGQIVNTEQKYVEGTTTHFSRYAIGSE